MDAVLSRLGIEAADAPRVGWLFLHSLFVGTFVSFVFCAGNAVFLGLFGADSLPWGYLVSGLLGALTVKAFARSRGRLSFCGLLFAQLGFLAVVVLALYVAGLLLPESSRKIVAFVLFVFTGPALTVVNLEFWGLARRLFDVRQSKRFNPLVATGETVASIAGFFLVPLLSLDETLHLLLPALAGLGGSMAVVVVVRRRFASELVEPRSEGGAETPAPAEALRDRYFGLTAAVMGLAVAAQYLVDFAFLSELEKQYTGAEQVAAFLGVFYGTVKVLDLLLKSLVSGRLVQYFGLRTALRVLPVALLVSAGLALLFGGESSRLFLFVALTKLLWPVLRKSIFDPAFKVLYQPLPQAQSLGLQSSIDGGVRQVGTFLIGLALLLSSRVEVGSRALLAGLAVLLVAWIVLTGSLYREYRRRLLDTLSYREPSPWARSPFEEIRRGLAQEDDEQRCSTLRFVAEIDPILPAAIERRLGPSDLGKLEKEFARRDDSGLRCRTLGLYADAGGAECERLLVEKLGFPDPSVRLAALRGLVVCGYRADGPVAGLLRQDLVTLARDMAWNLAALDDFGRALRGQPYLEPVCEALRDEIEEQRERVFLVLALLFDAGAVGRVRDGLDAEEAGGESAANALELLETLLSEELRPLVLPMVDHLSESTERKRLGRLFPNERLGRRERLSAVMQRSPGSLGVGVQAAALGAIATSCEDGKVAEELAASLFHPEPLLREVAALGMAKLDPEQLRRRLAKLPPEVCGRLLPLVEDESPGASAWPRTIHDRLRRLETLDAFAELPPHVKRAVAAGLEPSPVAEPGADPDEAPEANEIDPSLVVTADPSDLAVSMSWRSGGERESLPPELESHQLFLSGDRLRALLKRHVELLAVVLELRRSGRARVPVVYIGDATVKPSSVSTRRATILGLLWLLVIGSGPGLGEEHEPGVTYRAGRGLQVRSETFELRLGGRLLFDVSTFDGAFHAEGGAEGVREEYLRSAIADVLVRRGSLSFFGQYSVDSERWLLAFATYRGWKQADGVMGRQKEPFGLEYQSSSRFLSTLERPLSQALVPGISTGILMRGRGKSLTYAGGVFDLDPGKSAVTARLTWVPLRREGRVIHSGFAVSRRDHGGESLEIRSRGEVRRAATHVGRSSPITAETSTLFGLELAELRGPFSWQAEVVVQRVDAARPVPATPPVVSDPTVSYSGAYLLGSYVLTGESRGYHFERGRFGKIHPRGEAGAWELVARYSRLDLDAGKPGTRVENLTVGVNWHLDERVKWMAGYTETRVGGRGAADAVAGFDRGSALSFRLQFLF